MPVSYSRRGSQNRTFLNLTGSVAVVSVVVFALMFAGGGVSYADDPDSGISAAPDSDAPPTLIPDTTWESANQVLELPQECNPEHASIPCDQHPVAVANDSSSSSDDDDEEDVETAGIKSGAVNDADAGGGDALAMQQWGVVDEYENEGAEASAMMTPTGWVVTGVYPANTNAGPRMALMAGRSPWHFATAPMSSPLTQAARPPLNFGPWMTSPSTTWNRPAGGPMMMPGMSLRMR
ncbi:MAG: hypothetical protein Q7S58_03380 [Candidatus Binatus sp.]|uniref:hypothetical protein n=1 Tax=Candidatus Binatus sp. TaxID=2811406 RepID=UPI00271ECBC9|nr:hypothetical protein [Candidatus Binatus sp.]MDO8431431.1 hypothetical protein [Candidatus Binatus sp.]